MKTIQVSLTPEDGLNILNNVEEGWSLQAKEPESGRQAHIEFEVWADGIPTTHEVRLNNNGTWSFKTSLEV